MPWPTRWAQLPEDQQTAVEMKYLQGCLWQAIAEAMERSETTVGGLLRRGLKRLRELMHASEVSDMAMDRDQLLDEIVTAYLKAIVKWDNSPIGPNCLGASSRPGRRTGRVLRCPKEHRPGGCSDGVGHAVLRFLPARRPRLPPASARQCRFGPSRVRAPIAFVLLGDGAQPKPGLGTIRYFGDYELLEEIASRRHGQRFTSARQVSLNRIVALKMIPGRRSRAAPVDVQRFRAEAEAAANLQHPNIVAVFEVGEHEGQHFFSMEFIEGGSP